MARRRDLAARLGIEAVARQERIGPLAALARVRDPGQGPGVAWRCSRSAAIRSGVDGGRRGVLVGRRLARVAPIAAGRASTIAPVDALEPQLLAERPLAPRPGPVARLDPGPGERLVVEHPELGQPRRSRPRRGRPGSRAVVRRRRTSATDRDRASRNRAAASRTTAGSSTAARRSARSARRSAAFRHRRRPTRCDVARATAGSAAWRLLGLFDALDRERDLVDLAADPAVDLRGDVRAGLEEVLGGLAALARAGSRRS